MKKIISIMLIFAILSLSLGAYATSTPKYSEGYMYYTVTNGSATIVDTFGSPTKLVIPSSIAGYPVNTIASGALDNLPAGAEVTLPDTITSIEGSLPSGITVVYSKEEAVKYVAKNTTTNVEYTTLADALAKATTGQTVQLEADISDEKFVVVETGVILDINGKALTNMTMFYSTGKVIDTNTTARGYIKASGYQLSQNSQEYVPAYNPTTGGYTFFHVVFSTLTKVRPDKNYRLQFLLELDTTLTGNETLAMYSMMRPNVGDTAYQDTFKAVVSLTWSDTLVTEQRSFIYQNSFMGQVVDSALNSGVVGFTCTVSGLTSGITAEMQPQFYFYDNNGNVLFIFKDTPVYVSSDGGATWSVKQ